jgi:hypothetical protein
VISVKEGPRDVGGDNPGVPEVAGVCADYQAYAHETDARERALHTLMEKSPSLAEYLKAGVNVAAAWGLTFHQLFTAALTAANPPADA